MNIKKLFATLAGVSLFAQTVVPSVGFAATYSAELEGAYDWAYSKGVTTMSSIDNANMYGAITRAEMAKMLSVYAEKVLGLTANEAAACNFTDIDSVKWDLHDFIVKSCQLGIMGQGITSFRPYDTISRAEFGTALSRVLWGNKYEGGTPYYANHLNALKAAGIMNQIANAESTKEVRGYVMLMLQRSDEGGAGTGSDVDCNDEVVVLACQLGTDACPAACREDANEKENDEVVKSGSLAVTADSSADAKVFIGRPSDLDILTFKTSEEVEISKVVLERYGYSTPANVAYVWLENEEGTVITNKASVDSKGQVKLTLKKDYKKVDGELNATIVLETVKTNGTPVATSVRPEAWSTFGFKVVDVTSTAEDVDLANYKPATYEAIAYNGSDLTLISRAANAKTYNFEAGNMYEVAKFKVQTPDDSAIIVKGFTLKNNEASATRLDLRKFFDKAEVTVAGEAVKGLNAEANKNDELVVSFKDVEVAAKTKAEVIVKISLTEDFDTFNQKVTLDLTEINAVDAKVESRVSTTYSPNPYANTTYQFNGGKVKLTNTKLGNVDAAQNSEDVVVAEGTITVPETIKGSFYVEAYGAAAGALKQLTFVTNGDETDASPEAYASLVAKTTATAYTAGNAYAVNDYVTNGGKVYRCVKAVATAPVAMSATDFVEVARFYYDNVEIEKSGKIRFLADINDAATWNSLSVSFTNFGAAAFGTSLVYDESGKPVGNTEVSGTISFSKVTIQPAKASMSNSLTKDVEFMNKETNRLVVFDGKYTAKKGDVELNEFAIYNKYNLAAKGNTVTFYVYVNGEEVADAKVPTTLDATWEDGTYYVARDSFDKVLVKDGETATIKVEAEVEAIAVETIDKYDVDIRWEDVNGNTPSGKGNAKTTKLKIVDKGSVSFETSATKQTILKKANDAVVAQFTVKPADGASSVNIEQIKFDLTNASWGAAPTTANPRVTVKVDEIEEDDVTVATKTFTYEMNRNISEAWVTVVISVDDEADLNGTITLDNLYVNNKKSTKTFTKQYAEAAVEIVGQKSNSDNTSTIFTLRVDADSDVDVRNFKLYDGATLLASTEANNTFESNETISAKRVAGTVYTPNKATYEYSSVADAASCAAPYELNGGKTACQGKATALTAAFTDTGAAVDAAGPTAVVAGTDLTAAAGTYYTRAANTAHWYLHDGTYVYTVADVSGVASAPADTYYTLASVWSDVVPASCAAPYELNAWSTACQANAGALTAAYTATGDTVWNPVTVLSATLPDYFKIDGEALSVANLKS